MPAGELFFAAVSVINDDDEAAINLTGDLSHKILRKQAHFHTLARLGMNAIAVQILLHPG